MNDKINALAGLSLVAKVLTCNQGTGVRFFQPAPLFLGVRMYIYDYLPPKVRERIRNASWLINVYDVAKCQTEEEMLAYIEEIEQVNSDLHNRWLRTGRIHMSTE